MQEKQKYHISFLMILLYIWTFVEMFCVIPGTSETFGNTLGTIIPFLTISLNAKFFIMILISGIIMITIIIRNRGTISYDKMVVFMAIRIVLGIIQICLFSYTESDTMSMGNYLIWVVELFIYVSLLQCDTDSLRTQLIVFTKTISIVVSIQVYLQGIFRVLPSVSYSSVYYKACMIVPAGTSNFLSVLILPSLVAVMLKDKRGLIDNLFIIITGGAVFLTKSRFAIGILLAAFIYWVFFVNPSSKNNRVKKCLVILASLGVMFYVIYSSKEEILSVLYGYSDFVKTGGFLNKITSGRIGSFGEYFEKIITHPLIGNGPNYASSRAHNILIDSLYQYGLIGTILLTISFIELFRFSKRNVGKRDFFKIIVIVMLIHSLGEISFFTSVIADILFFSCLAVFSNEARVINQ